jgi:hypothetical protein
VYQKKDGLTIENKQRNQKNDEIAIDLYDPAWTGHEGDTDLRFWGGWESMEHRGSEFAPAGLVGAWLLGAAGTQFTTMPVRIPIIYVQTKTPPGGGVFICGGA